MRLTPVLRRLSPIMLSSCGSRGVAAMASVPQGSLLTALETPALIVDAAAFEANLDLCRQTLARFPSVALRPHAKAHKCGALGRIQVDRMGARGLCCQTVRETEVMAAAGVDDLLLTNQCVTPGKIARLLALRTGPTPLKHLGVLVDSETQVEAFEAALLAAAPSTATAPPLSLYVEVDAGQARCGVPPPPASDAVLRITQRILRATEATQGALSFGGLHCYHGFLQHVRSPADRAAAVAQGPVTAARASVDLLSSQGIQTPVVTGGGTGTYLFECEGGVHNEVQPGSFAFMDGDYGANVGMPNFKQSLFILTTVISDASPGRVVCDAGTKAVDQLSGPPVVLGISEEGPLPNVSYKCGGDEHGILLGEGTDQLKLGDTLLLQPSHCDPAVNLFDQVHFVRDGKVEAVFPIAARGPGC